MRRAAACILASCFSLLAAAAARADTWVVDAAGGPGSDFTSVQAAVDAAADGDVILVRPGLYNTFVIAAKALQVVGDDAAPPSIRKGFRVHDLAAGQAVLLRNLNCDWLAPPQRATVMLANNAGPVWIEDCLVEGYVGQSDPDYLPSQPAVLAQACAGLSFVRCTLQGGRGNDTMYWQDGPYAGSAALEVVASDVALWGSTLLGGRGGDSLADDDWLWGGDGGAGVVVEAGELRVSGGMLKGDRGGVHSCGWDFDIFSGEWSYICGADGVDAPAVQVYGGAPLVELRDATLVSTSPFGDVYDTSGTAQVTLLSWPDAELSGNGPVAVGESASLDLAGPPSSAVYLVVGGIQQHQYLAPFVGTSLIAAPIEVIFLGLSDPGGNLQVEFTVADLGAGTEALSALIQPLLYSFPLSRWLLGGPTALTLVGGG